MNLCAQSYKLAVSQGSQQLDTSNINCLKHCSNFDNLFFVIQKHNFAQKIFMFLTILTISNDNVPKTAFTDCLCNVGAVVFP
jgi:hypothetical protein